MDALITVGLLWRGSKSSTTGSQNPPPNVTDSRGEAWNDVTYWKRLCYKNIGKIDEVWVIIDDNSVNIEHVQMMTDEKAREIWKIILTHPGYEAARDFAEKEGQELTKNSIFDGTDKKEYRDAYYMSRDDLHEIFLEISAEIDRDQVSTRTADNCFTVPKMRERGTAFRECGVAFRECGVDLDGAAHNSPSNNLYNVACSVVSFFRVSIFGNTEPDRG